MTLDAWVVCQCGHHTHTGPTGYCFSIICAIDPYLWDKLFNPFGNHEAQAANSKCRAFAPVEVTV